MGDDLRDLAGLDAVVQGQIEVIRHVNRLIARDQSRKRNDAPVPRRESRPFPDVAEECRSRVLLERRGHPPNIVREEHGLSQGARSPAI